VNNFFWGLNLKVLDFESK